MDFFDKLGKKASEAYKMTADKTGKIAKETKIKFKIGELRKKVYEKHVLEGEISIENEIEEYCTKLDVLSDEIDSLLKQCLELKDKKHCPKCYSEIEKEMKFCPNCGYKQIIKDYLQEELEDSKQNEQENQDEKEKTNLEKTVAIESDIDIEENNKEQEE